MFQCWVKVVTPDYAYWSPLVATKSAARLRSIELAEDYALAQWPDRPERAMNFLSRIEVREVAAATAAPQ